MKKTARNYSRINARHLSKSGRRSRIKKDENFSIWWYGLAILAILVILVLGRTTNRTHVLGESISQSSEGEAAGQTQDTTAGELQPSGIGEGGQIDFGSGNPAASIMVDCIGPDGKHLQVDFKTCYLLNHANGHQKFSFTPLSADGQTTIANPKHQNTQSGDDLSGSLDDNLGLDDMNLDSVSTGSVDLKPGGLHGGGADSGDLGQALSVLRDNDIDIATNAGSHVIFDQGLVETESELPISVNLGADKLQVQTNGGVKQLGVLPDQALAVTLTSGILTSVSSVAGSSVAAKMKANLTQLNNQPVYSFSGLNNKRLLGFIPMAFAKVAYVSADSGKVVKVDQAAWSKFLELLSF